MLEGANGPAVTALIFMHIVVAAVVTWMLARRTGNG